MDIKPIITDLLKIDHSLFTLRDEIEKLRPTLAKIRAVDETEYQLVKTEVTARLQKCVDEVPLLLRGQAQKIADSLWK
jgi:hypothetical protein